MINRPLYEALKVRFGTVRVTNENVRRLEETKNGKTVVISRGEHYSVNCPLCADTKGRLSVSYLWLEKMPMSTVRRTELAHCFNESCNVQSEEFWRPILEDVELARIGALGSSTAIGTPDAPVRASVKARLPEGFITLDKLPLDHPAILFVNRKYNLGRQLLAEKYGVGFTDIIDMVYPQAHYRLIFPIYDNHVLVGWQGRVIADDDKRPRWFIPPGFIKTVYNADNVPPTSIPVVAEGIPAAIACGETGIGIFGKTVTESQLDKIASTWGTAILATDPDTYVPDNRPGGHGRIAVVELKHRLDKRLRSPAKLVQWPMDILEKARRYNNGEKVKVPDPADIGIDGMSLILRR